MPFAVGDVVAGRYEVQASLGQRPLGWLYRAREREIGVEVALRVIGNAVLPDEAARIAFTQRLTRARAFSHPSLVRVFGVYPQRDEVVVALQWAPGSTLADRVRERLFTMEEARPLIAQVAAGMTHAHQHGVILGDVHSETVVLLGHNIKIGNVGIGPSLPRKRFLEAVRGSPGFSQLAPEIRNGLPADTRADVYALAMLLVEMLSGGSDGAAVKGPPPLHVVLARALADDPLLRHTTVEALAQELDAVLSGQPVKVRRPTPTLGTTPPPREPPAVEDVKAKAPSLDDDDDRHPSQDLTKSMTEEELALLKGDQITRQVPVEEIFPLRVQSSDTHEVELLDLDSSEEGPTRTGDDLALEDSGLRGSQPPPSIEVDISTEQVVLLETDTARTREVPRLEPDDADTHRVEKARLEELAEADLPETNVVTPARPPSLSSLTGLADAPEPETRVDGARVRDPLEGIEPDAPSSLGAEPAGDDAKPPTIDARPKSRLAAEGKQRMSGLEEPIPLDKPKTPPIEPAGKRTLAVDEDAPTNTATPLPPPAPAASLPSLPSLPPAPSPPAILVASPPATAPSPTSAAPSRPSPPAPTSTPPAATPPAPRASTPRRKRRNPFETGPSDAVTSDEPRAANGTVRSPKHKRRSPFDAPPVAASAAPHTAPPRAGSKRRPPPPKATMLVMPIGQPRRVPLWLVLGAALALGATLTGLYMSRRVQAERVESERIAKQRLAEELQAKADALRKLQATPDAGLKPEVKPLVTPADTPVAVVPRSGPCPLGAHLVQSAVHSFCVDVYEYPGGNTMPRTGVSFAEAGHICAQRGERLCSEGEWERACRGKGNASYPYGQTFDPTRCNTKGNSGDIAPTGTFASCKSGSGAYDMSGNVAEWVASGAQKGGSANQGAKEARCSALVKGAPADGSVFVGFRCCADPTPSRR